MTNMTSSQSNREEIAQIFNFEEEVIEEKKETKKEVKKEPIKKVKNEIVKEEKVYPDHYELTDALFWIEDILGRGLIDWVLVGDIADQIRKYNDPTLLADKIELEILRGKFTVSGRKMISSWIPQSLDDTLTEIKVQYKNVPIHIKIIDRDPGYLKNPNTVFFYVVDFKIPNPYEVYLDVRNNNN